MLDTINIDIVTNTAFLAIFFKFLLTSTIVFSCVWVAEKTKILKSTALRKLAWKTAYMACFIATLPISFTSESAIEIKKEAAEPVFQALKTTSFIPSLNKPTEPHPVQSAFDSESLIGGARQDIELPNTPASLTIPSAPYSSPRYSYADFITALWMFITGGGILYFLISYIQSHRALGERKQVPPSHIANDIVNNMMAKTGLTSHIRLTYSHDIQSPVCVSNHEICLPIWAIEDELPTVQLESLLAHELGHIANNDPIMLLTTMFVNKLCFFQPLFLLARNRLVELAEFDADQWAIAHTNEPTNLAETLYVCAQNISSTRERNLHAMMASNNSLLPNRIKTLLKAKRQRLDQVEVMKSMSTAGVILVIALTVPNITFVADASDTIIEKVQTQFETDNNQNFANTSTQPTPPESEENDWHVERSIYQAENTVPTADLSFDIKDGLVKQISAEHFPLSPSTPDTSITPTFEQYSIATASDGVENENLSTINYNITFSSRLRRYLRSIAKQEARLDARPMQKRKLEANPYYDFPIFEGVTDFDITEIIPRLIEHHLRDGGIDDVSYNLHIKGINVPGYGIAVINNLSSCSSDCFDNGFLSITLSARLEVLGNEEQVLSKKKININLAQELKNLNSEPGDYIDVLGMKSLITVFSYRAAEAIQEALKNENAHPRYSLNKQTNHKEYYEAVKHEAYGSNIKFSNALKPYIPVINQTETVNGGNFLSHSLFAGKSRFEIDEVLETLIRHGLRQRRVYDFEYSLKINAIRLHGYPSIQADIITQQTNISAENREPKQITATLEITSPNGSIIDTVELETDPDDFRINQYHKYGYIGFRDDTGLKSILTMLANTVAHKIASTYPNETITESRPHKNNNFQAIKVAYSDKIARRIGSLNTFENKRKNTSKKHSFLQDPIFDDIERFELATVIEQLLGHNLKSRGIDLRDIDLSLELEEIKINQYSIAFFSGPFDTFFGTHAEPPHIKGKLKLTNKISGAISTHDIKVDIQNYDKSDYQIHGYQRQTKSKVKQLTSIFSNEVSAFIEKNNHTQTIRNPRKTL
ncbi:M56 family metallopeptidase [Kordiimonas sp. SCSIO 12610]|uniref:M56 family metallopeptidase n=1 Tax=Kordiimonas sp. SCSIO 12610 TaxID=2829597 RepID=UPI00210C7EF3|nr:M56 family metallopeptidase [Kordiimonas sp. SCSIO 12610]UTW56386.1 M56 family metallopeptidase [Kordiimonas sp. SCSIO 12610]